MPDLEDSIVDLIRTKGPRTGFEIQADIDADSLMIWKTCRVSGKLQVRTLGKRWMRLDRHVDGFARLSPSILREFLTYTVVGLIGDTEMIEKRCVEVADRTHKISKFKFELARQMVSGVMEEFEGAAQKGHQICFIIAGDIVYNMAHDVPRPERSTGKLVRGSDIDLVVVVGDDLPVDDIHRLDELIYRKKYRMLINPSVNEEVDYKIKRLGLIREQACFDDFKRMVAIKILHEGLLLYGSEDVYRAVKEIIREKGLAERLGELEGLARVFRDKAERSILDGSLDKETIRETHLFYSAEEFEEFE
ncbi:MAG TPA: hypothetical protein PLR60_00375 [Syntrophorhabdaceae bacterium]|nr:hypothetical protein [Syntrophorhabdaceae bacterium]